LVYQIRRKDKRNLNVQLWMLRIGLEHWMEVISSTCYTGAPRMSLFKLFVTDGWSQKNLVEKISDP
jgi:hypothetical protein